MAGERTNHRARNSNTGKITVLSDPLENVYLMGIRSLHPSFLFFPVVTFSLVPFGGAHPYGGVLPQLQGEAKVISLRYINKSYPLVQGETQVHCNQSQGDPAGKGEKFL